MKGDSSSRLFPSEKAVKRPQVPIAVEHGALSITVRIDGELRNLIVDTGSTVSILQPSISRSDVSVTALKPFGVTGEVLDVKGRQYVSLEIGGPHISSLLSPHGGGRRIRHRFLDRTWFRDKSALQQDVS